jgi:hypothetical protein
MQVAGSAALTLALALALGLCVAGADALAQSRRVIVNAERLNDAQVARLERANCRGIPDGAYWLNTQTGAWGYAGSTQVQGHFGDACRSGGNAGGADGRHGPYATLRRAQEVANQYGAQGYRALAFHSGDGYYVDVKR